MCTSEQHEEKMHALLQIEKHLHAAEQREVIYIPAFVSASQPFIMDYHERKHAFLWLPGISYTFNCEDFGTIIVPASAWTNLGLQPGVRMLIPAQPSTVQIIWKFTDSTVV